MASDDGTCEDEILIYAELLANLNHISVAASLPSRADGTTAARVTAGGRAIEITHADKIRGLELPAAVTTPGPGLLPLRPGSVDQHWRLPMRCDPDAGAAPAPAPFRAEDQEIPWTAADLGPACGARCRGCGRAVVRERIPDAWKDLPSEDWAEMMEFWHCHKPTGHPHGGNGSASPAADKGYGANASIAAQPGVGFVDVASIMLHRTDCVGLEYLYPPPRASEKKRRPAAVLCGGCGSEIGFVRGPSDEAVCLYKWKVECPAGPRPSLQEVLAATLVASMARSGSSKAVVAAPGWDEEAVEGDEEGEDGNPEEGTILNTWILNGNITHTSTADSDSGWDRPENRAVAVSTRKSIKLLFKSISADQGNEQLESVSSGVPEVTLPREAIDTCLLLLRTSNATLPRAERKFRGWDVGLLDRWVTGGTGGPAGD